MKDRFLNKIHKTSYCWEWTASRVNGYGRFGTTGRTVDYAHRVSWNLFKGDIPKGLYVCHKCDNRCCVNPKHLFLGTAKDNMQDASKKGRIKVPKASSASDETHQVAKLTNTQVKFIRKSKLPIVHLALKFKVHVNTVSRAKRLVSFKDVK